MAARGQEELTGNHVVASALKFGDGLPAVRLGESEPIAFVVYNSKGKCVTFVCKNCHDAGHRCAPLGTDEVNQTLSMTLRTRSVGVTDTNARGDDSLDDMLNSAANDFTVTNQLKSTSYKLQRTNVVDEVECALALLQLEEGIDDLPETFSTLLLTASEDGPVLTEARRLLGWAGGFSAAPTHTAWQAYAASLVQCRQPAHASTHIIDLAPELEICQHSLGVSHAQNRFDSDLGGPNGLYSFQACPTAAGQGRIGPIFCHLLGQVTNLAWTETGGFLVFLTPSERGRGSTPVHFSRLD